MTPRTRLGLALILLTGIHLVVLFAGFFALYEPGVQNRDVPFAPPTRLHFVDAQGKFHLRPFVYCWVAQPDNFGSYTEDRSRAYPLHFLVAGAAYTVAGIFQVHVHLFGLEQPGSAFLLGTDAFGRDQFSRLLYGGRISLLAGLLAGCLSLSLGILLGGLAGWYGGWVDEALMRLAELFLALPWLYLLFAVRAFLPLGLAPAQTFVLLITVIGLVGWARPARLIRGVVLSGKERDYVLAARGFGASSAYLLRRHVLPQASGVVLTQAALLVPQYILAEVTLSFLGLGVGEPAASWGTMLGSLQEYHVLASYWWMLAPGLVLVFVFLSYTAVANALHKRVGPISA